MGVQVEGRQWGLGSDGYDDDEGEEEEEEEGDMEMEGAGWEGLGFRRLKGS